MATGKAYIVDGADGAQQLKKTTITTSALKSGEALVKVHASSLNYRDHLVLKGLYGPGHDMTGRVPLSDGAGEVVEVAADVSAVKAGDRVAANFFPTWLDGDANPAILRAALGGAFAPGMLSDYVVLPAPCLARIPDALSFEEAASLPCAAVTAWYSLFETFRLLPGQTVVVEGTGGVSIFALQFAKAAGAKVVVTSSSDDKLARAKTLGADLLVNYRTTPDWDQSVIDFTDGKGADIIIEVGGPGTFSKALNAVATGGSIAVIGVLSGIETELNLFRVLSKLIRLHGVYVGSRAMFDRMNASIAANGIKPVVDKVFAFDDAAEAYAFQATNQHFGKIVIKH